MPLNREVSSSSLQQVKGEVGCQTTPQWQGMHPGFLPLLQRHLCLLHAPDFEQVVIGVEVQQG
jgi:hypothetical protein